MALDTAAAVSKLRTLTNRFDSFVAAAQPFYPTLARTVVSTGSEENYGWLANMPGMREWLGDRVFNKLRAARYSIPNKEFEASVIVDRTAIEDDQVGLYEPVMEQLAADAAGHPDELLFQVIMNGESQTGFDGQYFFDTDHAWADSGTQSNDLTATAATGTTPTEAEFRTAYHAARAALLGFKRADGKPFIRPTVQPLPNMVLLVPPALEEVATRALFSQLVNGGETNIVLDRPRIVVSASMTDATKFDLYNLGGPLKPYVFQARRRLQRQMKGLNDREFKEVKFMVDARYNVGYLAWWTAVRTTFT